MIKKIFILNFLLILIYLALSPDFTDATPNIKQKDKPTPYNECIQSAIHWKETEMAAAPLLNGPKETDLFLKQINEISEKKGIYCNSLKKN